MSSSRVRLAGGFGFNLMANSSGKNSIKHSSNGKLRRHNKKRRDMKEKTKNSASNPHVFDFKKKSIRSRQRRLDPIIQQQYDSHDKHPSSTARACALN